MSECSCPVHKTREPYTLPNGVPFSGRVTVECVSRNVASEVYEEHHSYHPETPSVNITHHGVFFDGQLVGCITYRPPLMRKMGDVDGSAIVEVARICVAVDMPNLASCAFSKSQEKFVNSYASQNGIERLVTYVREDYEGSMVAALRGMGWVCDGVSEASQAGNRPDKEIREWDKQRWIRDLDTDNTEQASVGDWV